MEIRHCRICKNFFAEAPNADLAMYAVMQHVQIQHADSLPEEYVLPKAEVIHLDDHRKVKRRVNSVEQ